MRWKLIAIGGAGLVAIVGIVVAARRNAATTPGLDTPKQKVSYAMGVVMAKNLKRPGVELDMDVLARGLKDGFSGEKFLMTENDLRETMSALQDELKQKQAQAVKTVAEANRKEGETFLAQNAREEGVVTLPSGLQYKILRAGDGKRPADTDTVECHYRGTRIDGAEFESSYGRGQPATFPVAGVIPGWKEALKLMPVGSKWKLFVPSQLAYGERELPVRNGAGRTIGPNATLIFEVELLAIKPHARAVEQTAAAKVPPRAKED